MRDAHRVLAATAAFAISLGTALAADGPAPAGDKVRKKEAESVSSDPQLTTATYGDWVERCQRFVTEGKARRLCEVATTVTASGQNGTLAEIALGQGEKGGPPRLTLVLPVNVAFPSAPKITAGDGETVELSWKRCVPAGCFAEAALSASFLLSLRGAKTAKVESKAGSGSPFTFEISLRGFSQAVDATEKEWGEARN